MSTTLNLEPSTLRAATAHRVYLKASWFDEWTRIPYLFAEEIAWKLAPQVGTAALNWDYGLGQRQGELTPAIVARLADKRRQFIKIEIDTHAVTADEIAAHKDSGTQPDKLYWYGTIELEGRLAEGFVQTGTSGGEPVLSPRGSQPFAAVGLEQLLYRHPIRGATWRSSTGTVERADRPYTFNRPSAAGQPLGNRSTARGPRSYLFSSKVDSNGGIAEDKKWTTRTIVEYLVANEVPKGAGGAEQIQIFVHEDFQEFLPDWDTPVIETEGLSCAQLLNLLMPRTRMLSWYLQVHSFYSDVVGAELETLKLIPVSLFGDIVTTDLGSYPPNASQIVLQTSATSRQSPECQFNLHESDIGKVDQVRVRGARRTTTCTLSKADNTIGAGWPDDLQDEYNTAYSAASGYAALLKGTKQITNAEIRSADRLATVFTRFTIGDNWNQTVANGLNGGQSRSVFLKDPSLTEAYKVNPRELEVAPTLPLRAGFDWTNIGGPEDNFHRDPTKLDDSAHNRLPALVIFKHPYDAETGASRYVQVETIGQTGRIPVINQQLHLSWSGRVRVPHQDRAIEIDVQGAAQHVLAYTDFTKLPVDEDVGRWDWRDALFTVCLYDDRFAEGVVPKDQAVDATLTNVRRELVVDAGDAYRLDYIVPQTVIGIDKATRGLLRCDLGGWINDDRKLLTARALAIFKYYGFTRRTLSLGTNLLTSHLGIGDYVVSIGPVGSEREVGTVVSEVTLTIPGGTERPRPASVHYTTAFAELEPGSILNRPHVRYHRIPEHTPTKILH